jgi:checkpoint serine/threonine-protein kinase
MSDTRPIPFQPIEDQKENIQPLREGRSAAALIRVFSVPTLELRESQEKERDQHEARIADTDDLDDPLQPFLDYIDWVLENFPAGHNAESGLIQLLERCTSQFRDTAHYKDDPRYLKVWTRYINYSDAPREMFVYIARKDIGKNLALFYEEYAEYLETNGKRLQAKEVYEAGIQVLARPITRLRRKYKEFLDRLEAQPLAVDEDGSPALPVARAALSVKESATTLYSPDKGSSNATSARSPREKLQVFNDPTNKHTEKSGGTVFGSGGWDSIGSLAARRKENVLEAKPWAGETLESTVAAPKTKLAIYKDSVSFFVFIFWQAL